MLHAQCFIRSCFNPRSNGQEEISADITLPNPVPAAELRPSCGANHSDSPSAFERFNYQALMDVLGMLVKGFTVLHSGGQFHI
jgi:hypothetical protein